MSRKDGFCDLYVPCPSAQGVVAGGRGAGRRGGATPAPEALSSEDGPPPPPPPLSLLVSSLLDRFRAADVTTIALTHTLHGGGAPNPSRDAADVVFPPRWIHEWEKRYRTGSNNKSRMRILTRLHAVVESASDLRHYQTQQQPIQEDTGRGSSNNKGAAAAAVQLLLRGYDVVSVAPRGDAAFQAACEVPSGAAMFDLITLEYFVTTAGGAGTGVGSGRAVLPFRIRAGHVRSAARNGLALEVPYAPALLNHPEASTYRRAFVQTLQELKSASLGLDVRVVVSSGPRGVTRPSSAASLTAAAVRADDSDAGPLAVRLPGDVKNLLTALLRWDPRAASASVSAHPRSVVNGPSSRLRRFGPVMASRIQSVRAEHGRGTTLAEPPARINKRRGTTNAAGVESAVAKKKKKPARERAVPILGGSEADDLPRRNPDDHSHDGVVEDGFISLN